MMNMSADGSGDRSDTGSTGMDSPKFRPIGLVDMVMAWLDPFAAGRGGVEGLPGHSIPIKAPVAVEEVEAKKYDATREWKARGFVPLHVRPIEAAIMPELREAPTTRVVPVAARSPLADLIAEGERENEPSPEEELHAILEQQAAEPSPAVADRIEATLDETGTDLAACRLELARADEMLATARVELAETEAMLAGSREAHAVAINIADQLERDLAVAATKGREWRGLAKARKRKLRRARRMLEEATATSKFLEDDREAIVKQARWAFAQLAGVPVDYVIPGDAAVGPVIEAYEKGERFEPARTYTAEQLSDASTVIAVAMASLGNPLPYSPLSTAENAAYALGMRKGGE